MLFSVIQHTPIECIEPIPASGFAFPSEKKEPEAKIEEEDTTNPAKDKEGKVYVFFFFFFSG